MTDVTGHVEFWSHAAEATQRLKLNRIATWCYRMLSKRRRVNSRPNRYPPFPVQPVVPLPGRVVYCIQVLPAQNHT